MLLFILQAISAQRLFPLKMSFQFLFFFLNISKQIMNNEANVLLTFNTLITSSFQMVEAPL